MKKILQFKNVEVISMVWFIFQDCIPASSNILFSTWVLMVWKGSFAYCGCFITCWKIARSFNICCLTFVCLLGFPFVFLTFSTSFSDKWRFFSSWTRMSFKVSVIGLRSPVYRERDGLGQPKYINWKSEFFWFLFFCESENSFEQNGLNVNCARFFFIFFY